jgi:hypothetical protein
VHLAVRPEAWTSRPPEISGPSTPPTNLAPPIGPSPSFLSSQPQMPFPHLPSTPPVFQHNPYILHKHRKAILALLDARAHHIPELPDFWRGFAVQTVERNGWLWPSILDEEFPAVTDDMPTGLIYERVMLEYVHFLCRSHIQLSKLVSFSVDSTI